MPKHLAERQPARFAVIRLKAQQDHADRVASARSKIEAYNANMLAKKVESSSLALQKASARFLPPGAKNPFRSMNLDLWPYAGNDKIAYSITPSMKQGILSQDVMCGWCRKAPSTTVDHVHPLSRGGSNSPLNLVGSCSPCNSAKADFLPKELGWVLRHPQRAYGLIAESMSASCQK